MKQDIKQAETKNYYSIIILIISVIAVITAVGLGQVIGPFVDGRLAESGASYALAFIAAGVAALAGGVAALFLKISKINHE